MLTRHVPRSRAGGARCRRNSEEGTASSVAAVIADAAGEGGLTDAEAAAAFLRNQAAVAELAQRLRAPTAQHAAARWAPSAQLLHAATAAGVQPLE